MKKNTLFQTLPLLLALAVLPAGCAASTPPVSDRGCVQESQAAFNDQVTSDKQLLMDKEIKEQPLVKKEVPEAAPTYDFSQPAPASEAVDNSYFEDAAFVGDSRTDGFMIYSGIGCGKNLTSNGLSIFKLAEKKAITIDQTQYTLLEALELEEYGKVYLSLGVNELGYHNDNGFYEAYCQAIDMILQSQTKAVIYIQGLIPLNEEVIAETGGASYLKNDHLQTYNDLMKQVAEEKQVVFLDLYSQFAQEDGQLPREASTDGIHLRKAYCEQWLDYLKTHTVSYEQLYGEAAA